MPENSSDRKFVTFWLGKRSLLISLSSFHVISDQFFLASIISHSHDPLVLPTTPPRTDVTCGRSIQCLGRGAAHRHHSDGRNRTLHRRPTPHLRLGMGGSCRVPPRRLYLPTTSVMPDLRLRAEAALVEEERLRWDSLLRKSFWRMKVLDLGIVSRLLSGSGL